MDALDRDQRFERVLREKSRINLRRMT